MVRRISETGRFLAWNKTVKKCWMMTVMMMVNGVCVNGKMFVVYKQESKGD